MDGDSVGGSHLRDTGPAIRDRGAWGASDTPGICQTPLRNAKSKSIHFCS